MIDKMVAKEAIETIVKEGIEISQKIDTSKPLDLSNDRKVPSTKSVDLSKSLDTKNNSSQNLDTSKPIDFSKDTEASSQLKEGGTDELHEKDIEKQGGSYGELKKEGHGWNHEPPQEIHHMPADEASPLDRNDGPAIAMDYEDHRQTASCGNSREAQEYRAKQKELIAEGKFAEAMQMDIDDIRDKFGSKYDDAIAEMKEYAKSKGYI